MHTNLTFESLRATMEQLRLKDELNDVKGLKPDYLIEVGGKFYKVQFPYRRDPEFMRSACTSHEQRQWPADWQPRYPRYAWLVSPETRWHLLKDYTDGTQDLARAATAAHAAATNTIAGIQIFALDEAERTAFMAEVVGKLPWCMPLTLEPPPVVYRPAETSYRSYDSMLRGTWVKWFNPECSTRLVLTAEATPYSRRFKPLNPRDPLSRKQRLRQRRLARRRGCLPPA